MLDPFSAISLASSIVQFVDFGKRLVSEGRELYESADGALAKHVELEAIIKDIKLRSEKSVTVPGASEDEVGLRKLVELSKAIANGTVARAV